MTTEREIRDAKRLIDREYPCVIEMPKRKRLKSLSEMEKGQRITGLKHTISQPSRFRRRRNPIQYLIALTSILGVVLVVSVEASCRVNGDPIPHQDWRVGYGYTPMIAATDIQNCRINTWEYWKARSIDWFRDLV